MDIAALILSFISLMMSGFLLVDYLAQKKSTHKIQIVDPMSMLTKDSEVSLTKPIEELREFDMPDAAEIALKQMNKSKNKDLV